MDLLLHRDVDLLELVQREQVQGPVGEELHREFHISPGDPRPAAQVLDQLLAEGEPRLLFAAHCDNQLHQAAHPAAQLVDLGQLGVVDGQQGREGGVELEPGDHVAPRAGQEQHHEQGDQGVGEDQRDEPVGQAVRDEALGRGFVFGGVAHLTPCSRAARSTLPDLRPLTEGRPGASRCSRVAPTSSARAASTRLPARMPGPASRYGTRS